MGHEPWDRYLFDEYLRPAMDPPEPGDLIVLRTPDGKTSYMIISDAERDGLQHHWKVIPDPTNEV